MTRLFTTLTLVLALTLIQLGLPAPAEALYRLDFGDSISVTVRDAPQYSITSAIRPDGAITVPYIGDLEVKGLTPAQVAERVEKLLARFVRDPQVSVNVMSFRPWTITVFGQVNQTGNVKVQPSAVTPTVLDAIAAAGGFTDRANRSEVVLLRGTGANATRHVVNVESLLKGGDPAQNMPIQDHDTIVVAEVWYPDYRQALTVVGTVASVITMLTLIANTYNRAAGQ